MCFTRSFRALLWRNFIYRKRRWLPSVRAVIARVSLLPLRSLPPPPPSPAPSPHSPIQLIEFFLPALCVAALYFIKLDLQSDPNSRLQSEAVDASFPGADDAIVPLSFRDCVTALRAERVCVVDPNAGALEKLLGLAPLVVSGVDRRDWPVPFVFCDSYACRERGEDAATLCTYRTLALAPLSSESEGEAGRALRFKAYVEGRYPQLVNKSALPFEHDFVQVFDSNDELQSYITSEAYGAEVDGRYFPKVAVGVVFGGGDDPGKSYEYVLRTNSTNYNSQEQSGAPVARTTPNTARVFDHYNREDGTSCSTPGGPDMGKHSGSCTGQYLLNGAVTVQRLVDDWILSDSGVNATVAQSGAVFLPYPTKEYTKSGFYETIGPFAPLLFTLGLLYPVSSTIRSIVLEKELRQKELMKMMSVTDCDIGWSWFASFYLFFAPAGAITAVFTNLLYSSSSFAWLFVFWQFTFVACIVYCFVVAATSTKATRATLIGIMLFFVGYFLPFVIIKMDHRPLSRCFRSTLSHVFWGAVSWYLNRALRGDYGTALKWYFPLQRQYWCPRKALVDEAALVVEDDNVPIEAISEALKRQQQSQSSASVHIHSLRKQFGDKTAVNGLNLSLFALLGHNGAGKTTTIAMLTGMVPPTSGYATVAGYDIRTDLALLREKTGVCLQHDCLFPQLSVLEHIIFFSWVKGLYAKKSKEDSEKSVLTAIEDVALLEKRYSFARDLSGGMKRKLSVAIAFCEPTSGMDPFSRRFTWNVIRKYRESRCIVLTTHFMDEADLLGDRIAIMAEGQLRCVGSPLYLKKYYGVGYQLTIIKSSTKEEEGKEEEDCRNVGDENGKLFDLDGTIVEIVQGAVPTATVLSNVGIEIRYQLPMGQSEKFIGMFQRLDELIANGDINTYGISITTLDEVFLMVAQGQDPAASLDSHDTSEEREDTSLNNCSSNQGSPYWLNEKESFRDFQRHVRALFSKRVRNFKRDKKAWFCSIILPTILTLVGFLIVNFVNRRNPNYPSLTLSLDQNNPDIVVARNPIPFNEPGIYLCQPGQCVFGGGTTMVTETSERYFFCGANAQVDAGKNGTVSVTTCSIENSSSFLRQISQHGAFGVGFDVSNVLNSTLTVFETSHLYEASMYGSIFFTHDEKSTTSNNRTFDETVIGSCSDNTGNYITAEQCRDFGGIGYIVNYNFTSLHSSLQYQALADEAIMRHYLNDVEHSISASVWPLPITHVEQQYTLASNSFAAWFLIVLSFPFIGGAFATFIVAERESKAKHLQTVAGVQPKAYWLSTYIWDIVNYQIPLWTIIALMYILDVKSFTTNERQAASSTISLLVLFGPAACGFTYLVCFAFNSPSMANLFVIVFNFFIGMAGPLVCVILRLLAADPSNPNPRLKNAAIGVEWVLRFIPSFCLGKGLLFTIYANAFEYIEAEPLTSWSPAIALYEVIFLGVESIVYIFLAIQADILSTKPKTAILFKKLSDFLMCKCLKRQSNADAPLSADVDDEDVFAENVRVQQQEVNDLIVLRDLSKVYYDGKRAVDRLSLGIPPGECFGLLGINGAGKTTTMAMLTAEFPPSSGDAMLAGLSVTNEPEQTRRRIGYCPQFDAHFANMTGWEHVELYAVIKGVPRNMLKGLVAAKLKEVGLSEFDGKRLSSKYSGGMKRKLSLAIATIGSPQIVFLDEPSTGMDPVARRDMWKVISRMVQGTTFDESERTSVILTTHSMEECEALCPRIGIMAGGKLRCLGSAQHLKERFGQGYQIEVKVKHPDSEDVVALNTTRQVLQNLDILGEDIEALDLHELASNNIVSLESAKDVCAKLTGDDHLSKMISPDNPYGYHIFKLADSSAGLSVDELVGFCVEELRIKAVLDFFESSYASSILRERQDNKVRFEINSEGTSISSLFANIEKNKDALMMDDYSVSQTSLEQVFNSFAAIAEKEMENTMDSM
ncbi:hypothetical protein ACHAWF_018531 [Thalassiosira exigua]